MNEAPTEVVRLAVDWIQDPAADGDVSLLLSSRTFSGAMQGAAVSLPSGRDLPLALDRSSLQQAQIPVS